MQKSKYITQISGIENDWYWSIGLRVSNDGKIDERYTIQMSSHTEGRKYYYDNQETLLQNKRDYYSSHQDLVKEQVKN